MTVASRLYPAAFRSALRYVHPTWLPAVQSGLAAVQSADPEYLSALDRDGFLPTGDRLFAAFAQPMDAVRYVLVGEGPYPRAESATGFCFMDGAVGALWSDEDGGGLSKKVNRATSLRNFIKMLLVAGGHLPAHETGAAAVAAVAGRARQPGSDFIQTLDDLQGNMSAHGFLLLNASLVFRPEVAPAKDAKAWQAFLEVILLALYQRPETLAMPKATLVLWGKIAEQLSRITVVAHFPKKVAEHPYNLSFIANQAMQSFFGPMQLMIKFPESKNL